MRAVLRLESGGAVCQFAAMNCAAFKKYLTIGLLTLAFIGLFVRALVPAGFMPDFSSQSETALVICSGVSEKTIYLDENGTQQEAPVHKAEAPCEYSLTFHFVKQLLPVLIAFLPVITDVNIEAENTALPVSIASLPFSARGPPSISL